MTLRQLREVVEVELLGGRHGDAAGGDGPQRRGALAAFEHGSLAEHRAGAELGDRLAVDLDRQDAVEQEEQLGARCTLLDQELAGLRAS